MYKLFVLFICIFTLNAHAFIPASDYLLEKVTKGHGKGLYSLEQEVVFRSDTETLVLKEKWLVQDAETMRVTVSGGSVDLAFVILGTKAYYAETVGQLVSRKLSPESLERFFHVRSEKTLSDLLMNSKVVTLHPLRARQRPKDIKLIKPENDPYVSLMRVGDEVTYLVSSTIDPKEAPTAPGLWIDQEQYTIRKIRFPSAAEILATNYQSLSNDLVFPKLRSATWGTNNVEIRLIKASSIAKSKELEANLQPASISQAPLNWGSSSLTSMVKEFYQRFR